MNEGKGMVSMEYIVEKVTKEEQQTSLWSGGTTTQLAIYPKKALYSDRNFLWRLSSAKVEIDETVFTSLPGIRRQIMVIEGALTLIHEGHHEVTLEPYEKDSFDGTWTTRSVGKVTDFNLMMADGCKGELHAFHIGEKKSVEVELISCTEYAKVTEAFYCTSHSIEVQWQPNRVVSLREGELLLIHRQPGEELESIHLQNVGQEIASMIHASIVYCEFE